MKDMYDWRRLPVPHDYQANHFQREKQVFINLKFTAMRRAQGTIGVALVECINHYIGKYRVRWDIQPETGEDADEQAVSYYETEIILRHKPNINDIKQAVLEGVNRMIDEKIISEFVWNDMPVWLSSENQFNYKAAYDLSVQTGGQTLPVLFKFGDTENPIYHQFTTHEELSDFYIKAMQFISDTLSAGWVMKDSINWSEYEELLNKI